MPDVCKQNPDIFRCIGSSHDRLGFYAEAQNFLGQCRVEPGELEKAGRSTYSSVGREGGRGWGGGGGRKAEMLKIILLTLAHVIF